MIRLLSSNDDLARYDAWICAHPQGTLWQSLSWKRFQEAIGREVRIYAAMDHATIRASALVVIDKTRGGFSTWSIPRGPLGEMNNGQWIMDNDRWIEFLRVIKRNAQKDRCLSMYFSPAKQLSIINYPLSIHPSSRHEQPEATRLLDLTQSEEDILAQMHPKGRYNIKVARRHGVRIERSDDVHAFARLAQETARRDGFRALPAAHYGAFLEQVEGSFLLLASAPTTYHLPPTTPSPIAALIGTVWNGTGIYYYGASSSRHRNLMAPYLLQWEAMKLCKEAGCERYDLLGIAPTNVDVRHKTQDTSHPWTGVSSFKEKFGGTVVSYPPEQEITLRPVLKRMLVWKRRFF